MKCIIVAQKEEVLDCDQWLKNFRSKEVNFQKFYLLDINTILVFSGIGKTNATITAMNAICNFKVLEIINIGVAGSFSPTLKINEVVLVNFFYYLDVDVTDFGYKFGQIPKFPAFFVSSSSLNFLIANRFKKMNIYQKYVNVGSSDSFINIYKHAKLNDFFKKNISITDMEAAAIAHVCYLNNVFFSSIKIISDTVNELSNVKQYGDNLEKCAKTILKIIAILI